MFSFPFKLDAKLMNMDVNGIFHPVNIETIRDIINHLDNVKI